jgi:hypothetical protein
MKIVSTFLLVIILVANINAQEYPLVLDKQGVFEILSRTDYNNEKCGFTKAEIAENLQRINDLVSIMRKSPVLASPVGFQGRARIYDVHCDDFGSYGIPARVSFEFCSYFKNKNGAVVNNTIEPPEWSIFLNKQNPTGYGFYATLIDRKYGMFTVPLKKETLANGMDVYDNDCYVIYDPQRPAYWLPVTVNEAFNVVREYWNSQPDKATAAEMLKWVEKEYSEIPVSDRNNPAYYGGNISRVSSSSGYGGEENLFPRIMKVNPLYWDKKLSRSSIQIMYFKLEGDKAFRHKNTEEALMHNSTSYHERKFKEGLDLGMLKTLLALIGK